LKSSIPVPTTWKINTTRSSRQVSSFVVIMIVWMITAATVTASLRAVGNPSGYQSLAASRTSSMAAPKTQAHACLAPNTRNSTSHRLPLRSGSRVISRWAAASMRCSTPVSALFGWSARFGRSARFGCSARFGRTGTGPVTAPT